MLVLLASGLSYRVRRIPLIIAKCCGSDTCDVAGRMQTGSFRETARQTAPAASLSAAKFATLKWGFGFASVFPRRYYYGWGDLAYYVLGNGGMALASLLKAEKNVTDYG
jgi:hypothetical protein